MANSRVTINARSMPICATCSFWSGWRETDGIGDVTYDQNNNMGKCNQVAWKGFGGATMQATMSCQDYHPLVQ